jgi:uncharacterized protein (TIGR02231 family)
MKAPLVMSLVLLTAVCVAGAAREVQEKGTVEAVTLFRGQALVTRLVPFDAPAGPVELTVTDLPHSVLGESLFVSAGTDAQVRAVRFHTRAVGKAPEKEVQALDDEIADVEKKLRENSSLEQVIVEKKTYLTKLESFVAPAANVEMTKGVLNAETIAELTAMTFNHRTALAKELFDRSETARDLQEKLALLRRKRGELTRSHSRTLREAIVFLDKTRAGETSLRFNYLVRNASWSPTYNVRGSLDKTNAVVEVGALAQQTSGEDWDNAELTLSTAGAQLVAEGPSLAPLWLHLTKEPEAYGGAAGLDKRLRSATSKLRSGQLRQQTVASQTGQTAIQWDMNRFVHEVQQIELSAEPQDFRAVRRRVGDKGSGLAVNYKIDGKVSLASRHDNQLVQIAKLTLPCSFFYEATPLLTEQVHRYAAIMNDSTVSLLEGSASVYLDGEFMGRANVPMVARGQRVIVGFGTDPQLRAWREFISRDERGQLLGRNKRVTYRYRLVLDNYSDKPVLVRALDRIPMQTDTVSVTVDHLSDPLSKDAEYLRVFRPQGRLRWDIEVPAKSARDTARIVEYSFKLEFDAKLHIAPAPSPAAAAKERAKFEEIRSSSGWMR